MWRVAALAEESDQVYVYSINAPEDAKASDVTSSAYAQHGKLFRAGEVEDFLGPMHSTEWIGDKKP